MSAAPIFELLGRRVRSPVPLGDASPDGGDADHDVTVGAPRPVPDDRPPGTLLCELATDDRRYYAATRTGTGYVVRYFGTCDFEISSDRRAIRCTPGPDVTADYVAVLLGGGVMAFLLLLDGACVLHASAVTAGGRSIALVGGSGSGKSTLAALLCLDGATLVSDDVLRIELGTDGEIRAVGGVPELRLRESASGLASRFGPPARTRTTADGRTAVSPQPGSPVSARLDAIVLPRLSRTATATRVEALGAADAMLRLAASPRLSGVRDADLLRASFRHTSELATRVPVFDAELPWGAPVRDRLARDLLAALDPI